MKKTIQLFLIAFVAFVIFSTGCKKSDTVTTPGTVNTDLIAGTWEISSFTQRTEDKTSDFAGLTFTFSTDAKLVVSGGENVTGSWSYTAPSSGYYGSPTGSFSLSLGTDDPLRRLTRSWSIVSQTNTVLKLDATEASEDEHVTFTKK